MTKKQKRMSFLAGMLVIAGAAIALVMSAMSGSITYFYTPGDIAELAAPPTQAIRLGGLVAEGSVQYGAATSGPDTEEGAAQVRFTVTDGVDEIRVSFVGILPDLFREGQGVIVQGRLTPDGRSLIAANVLAKHDENYMPREVAEALKKNGHWQAGQTEARPK